MPPAAAPVHIERETDVRESSGIVLGRVEGARHAFIADEDEMAIVEVDLERSAVVRTTALGSRPRDVLLLPEGTLAATLPDAGAIVVLTRFADGELRETRRAKAPVEPMAMALSPDDANLFVSSGAAHALVQLQPAKLIEVRRWELPREPRAVLVGNDGDSVFVSHGAETVVSVVHVAENRLDAVDIGEKAFCGSLGDGCTPRRHARNAQALVRMSDGNVVVPAAQALPNPPLDTFVLMNALPPESKKFIAAEPGAATFSGYGIGSSGDPPIFMDVATLDRALRVWNKSVSFREGTTCLLPRAAINVKDQVFVACLGSNRVERLDNPQGRAASELVRGRSSVPAGPTALAAERDGEHLVVWSSFARKVSRIATEAPRSKPLAGKAPPKPIVGGGLTRPESELAIPRTTARDERWLHGRELFFSNTDTRISADGRACASCHVDGRDDGITWQTPMGPRRTRTLAGQLAVGPYGWRGEHPTLEAHVKVTFRQLRGTGLPDDERDALLTYVRSLQRPPLQPSDESARGQQIFAAAECGSCHDSGAGDRNVHDVGTGGSFMTPTLAGIGSRRQLMHDGRYKNLDDLLLGAKAMGRGSELSVDDRHALVSYLETL